MRQQSRLQPEIGSHLEVVVCMVQMPLNVLSGRHLLQVTTDYGRIGKGASDAHYVEVANGQEYIAKGPFFTPQQPYVAANEYVATRLADILGLPVLDYRFVELAGNVLFASAWMDQSTFHPSVNETLFKSCANADIAYELVVFDVWVTNIDRHHENLIARHPKKQPMGVPRLLLNDHGHCILSPGVTPGQLASRVNLGVGQHIVLPFIRDAITDPARLGKAVDRAVGLSGGSIDATLQEVPDCFLQPQERGMIAQFLKDRQTQLRTIFQNERSVFTNLAGGAI